MIRQSPSRRVLLLRPQLHLCFQRRRHPNSKRSAASKTTGVGTKLSTRNLVRSFSSLGWLKQWYLSSSDEAMLGSNLRMKKTADCMQRCVYAGCMCSLVRAYTLCAIRYPTLLIDSSQGRVLLPTAAPFHYSSPLPRRPMRERI